MARRANFGFYVERRMDEETHVNDMIRLERPENQLKAATIIDTSSRIQIFASVVRLRIAQASF